MITREQIVAEARSWIGTPYHHSCHHKGLGVDCGQLLLRVYSDVGAIESFDYAGYEHNWYLFTEQSWYYDLVASHSVKVESPLPGDAVLWKMGRNFCHGSIVTCWPRVVHADPHNGQVEETDSTNSPLSMITPTKFREKVFFSPKDFY